MKQVKDYPILNKTLNEDKRLSNEEKAELAKLLIAIGEPNIDMITIILRAHLLSETYLNDLILHHFRGGRKITDNLKFTYVHKLEIVNAAKLLHSTILGSLRGLNQVRNNCAHVFDYEITKIDIDKIGKPFGKEYNHLKVHSESFRALLQHALLILIGSLYGHLKDS